MAWVFKEKYQQVFVDSEQCRDIKYKTGYYSYVLHQ